MMNKDEVVLVNELDEPLGLMEKMEAHRKGLLHRAFSVFIFNKDGKMLLQKRAATKYHSPGLWTNACCSHPRNGEPVRQAAERRLKEELGFVTPLEKVFDFVYHASFSNGLAEYEYDHVFVGEYPGNIQPDPNEVSAVDFKSMADIRRALVQTPEEFTAWFPIAFEKLDVHLATSSK